MRIEIKFFNPNKKQHGNAPERFLYAGNYAVETMLIRISEIYFGKKVSDSIEALLKTRIGDD